ncbi:MAG: amidohydrolase [Crocinitomicaceae bacterium]|jgi:predicted amidohydrolase|nr:amidohydrolase [Crocinitomicaceae bacterium]
MQDLKLSLVQCSQYWEDKAQNLGHMEILLSGIEETDLILLPEMFHTAFSMNAQDLAENCENSGAIVWLKQQAAIKNAAIYTSFIAEEEGNYFNRGIFVYPDGKTVFYNKRKLFTLAKEEETYTPGNEQVIVRWKDWSINLQICYDLRFPEISRNRLTATGEAEYDLCLYVANWPERRAHHWKSLLAARAIENQCYVAGLNRVGEDGKQLTYSGDSNVYNALGEKLAADAPGKEEIITALLSKTDLLQVRQNLNFLKDA